MEFENDYNENFSEVNEHASKYIGFVHKSEDDRLRENIFRSPMEKLSLFTQMLRREALYKKANIIRK